MTTYLAVTWSGKTRHFSAMTQSDAYQQANEWAEDQLKEFHEI